MSNVPHSSDSSLEHSCPAETSETLHQYLDGELPVSEQPGLFEHLASCDPCRQMMDAVMVFRRMSRQEYIALPPATDDAFFKRLAEQKQMSERIDRLSDRAPLWNARRSVSLRSALALAVGVFTLGLLLPMPSRTNYTQPLIQLTSEKVDFTDFDSVAIKTPIFLTENPIYIFLDGPTIEASRVSEADDF